MMECADYRRAVLADPHHPTADMRSHAASCHDCTRYGERILAFESRLDRALRVPGDETRDGGAGANGSNVIPLQSTRSPARPAAVAAAVSPRVRRGWFAAAASVLVAICVAGGLWLALPRPSLAADVVGHMADEPGAWSRTDVPVPSGKLERVLSDSRVRLKSSAGLVSYANSCPFRGHRVPHLVVQTAAGPVTVMVLTHEAVNGAMHFDEQGYRGMIVPIPGHGSVAVLERGPNTDMKAVEEVAARVRGAIDFTT